MRDHRVVDAAVRRTVRPPAPDGERQLDERLGRLRMEPDDPILPTFYPVEDEVEGSEVGKELADRVFIHLDAVEKGEEHRDVRRHAERGTRVVAAAQLPYRGLGL